MEYSFLQVEKLEPVSTHAGRSKFFYRSKLTSIKKNYTVDNQLGGQDNYFENLYRGAYRQDKKLTERTWLFLFKYLIVLKNIKNIQSIQ